MLISVTNLTFGRPMSI